MDERNIYREAFSHVRAPLSLRQGLAELDAPKRRLRGRAAAVLVAAAILTLLTVSAAAGVFGTEIESWFSGHWAALTGGDMSEGQRQTISRLTTPVGQSQTADDVTVTLDSQTTDGENLYLLITVKGICFSKKEAYSFDDVDLFLRGAEIDSYSFRMLDITADGTLRCLVDACFLSPMEESLRLTLRLRDLVKGPGRGTETVQEGCWEFSCTVDAPEQAQALTCERAEVTSYDTGNRKVITTELWDIRLTAAGVSFRCRDDILGELYLLMKNGEELTHAGGERLEEDGAFRYLYIWKVPVDLSEVSGIRIDGTEIPLS
ncbi:MAG: DUF4179 domain-containing protein [Oscillospiraceae bacterium]